MRWYVHVFGYCVACAKVDRNVGVAVDENKGYCTTGAPMICVDWGFDSAVAVDVPASVVVEG